MNLVGVIIQARMGSTRLPGKVLKDVGHKPLLKHITDKLKKQGKYPFIVATSTLPDDYKIAAFCESEYVSCFRGNEQDVLDRYYQCAKSQSFQNIVRLTADNPFVDVDEMDKMIQSFLIKKPDYMDNFSTLPIGAGCEVFTFKSLEESHRRGTEAHHREHVNEYIQENPQLYKRIIFDAPISKKFPEVRLTIDTPLDLNRANFICQKIGTENISTEDAIQMAQVFG